MSVSLGGRNQATRVSFPDSCLATLPKELMQMIFQFIPADERLVAVVNFGLASKGAFKVAFSTESVIYPIKKFGSMWYHARDTGLPRVQSLPVIGDTEKLNRKKFVGLLASGVSVYCDHYESRLYWFDSQTGQVVHFDYRHDEWSYFVRLIDLKEGHFALVNNKGVFLCDTAEATIEYHRFIGKSQKDPLIDEAFKVGNVLTLLLSRKNGGENQISTRVRFDLTTKSYIEAGKKGQFFTSTVANPAFYSIDGSDLFFLRGKDTQYPSDFCKARTEYKHPLQQVVMDINLQNFSALQHQCSAYNYDHMISTLNTQPVGKRVYRLHPDGSKKFFAKFACPFSMCSHTQFVFTKNEQYVVGLHEKGCLTVLNFKREEVFEFQLDGSQAQALWEKKPPFLRISHDFLLVASKPYCKALSIFYLPTKKDLFEQQGLEQQIPFDTLDILPRDNTLELVAFTSQDSAIMMRLSPKLVEL